MRGISLGWASALACGVVSFNALASDTIGGWTALPDRENATFGGQLVVLRDGRLLQLGGFDRDWSHGDDWSLPDTAATTDCEIYDPRHPRPRWVECKFPMPTETAWFWAVTLPSGNVLVAGNFLDLGSETFTSYVFVAAQPPGQNPWVQISSDGGPEHQLDNAHSIMAPVILPDGSALLAGGGCNDPDGGCVFASDEAYRFIENPSHPEQGRWEKTADMPFGAVSAGFAKLSDGRALFVGGLTDLVGFNDAGPLFVSTAQATVYDPRTGTWTALDDMPGAVGVDDETASLRYSGAWWFQGGPDCEPSDGPGGTCPPEGNWKNPGSRWHPGIAALHDGDALIVGGTTINPTDEAWSWTGSWYYGRSSAVRFDGATDTWSEVEPSHLWRETPRAVALPFGYVLANGGNEVSGAEIYSPYTDRWYDAGSYSDLPGCLSTGWSVECYNFNEYNGQLRALPDGRVVQTCGRDWTRPYPYIGCDHAWIWSPWTP